MLLVNQRLVTSPTMPRWFRDLELTLEVDEIGGSGVEALGEQSPRKNAISGCDLRKLSASSNTKAPTGEAARAVARMGTVQKHGHLFARR